MAAEPVVTSSNRDLRRMIAGGLFMQACNEALQAYGTFNSSPQTTELFARAREKTLLKWVRIGSLNAIALGTLGAWIAGSLMPLFGTVLVVTELELLYRHAAKAGKEAPPPTFTPTRYAGARA